jgi:hypothetical protein
MPPVELKRLDCTNPGRGPWKVVPDIRNRSINVRHQRSRYIHRVYYGTRTERTQEEAEAQATALCAILNLLKAKRP